MTTGSKSKPTWSDPPALAAALARSGVDGWLLTDYRGDNPLARRLAGLDQLHLTRRWFALVDRAGGLTYLAASLEAPLLRSLGLEVREFAGWRPMQERLADALRGLRRVAMEYRPEADLPALSRVDGGTLELVRRLGPEVVSSADLVQELLGRWSPVQAEQHRRAAGRLAGCLRDGLDWLGRMRRAGESATETDLQHRLVEAMDRRGLVADAPPVVGFAAHSGDPHYSPPASGAAPLAGDGPIVIDLWARLDEPWAPYADMTWMVHLGRPVESYARIWEAVRDARDAAVELLQRARKAGRPVLGFEVDQAARRVLAERGFGEHFIHRLGHSLGMDSPHGFGANLDDFESHETRELLVGSGFTIEPGAYFPEWGARSEIDVILGESGPEITTPVQTELEILP